MTVTITKSNQTVPAIPNDQYPGSDDHLYSVYQSSAFSIDVSFSITGVNITSITPTLSGGYTSVGFSTVSSNPENFTVRVSGTFTNVLNVTESFNVVLDDFSVSTNVPINSLPATYKSLSKWNMPPEFWRLLSSSYTFNIVGEEQANTSITVYETAQMSQYVYWGFEPSLAVFQSAIAGGS